MDYENEVWEGPYCSWDNDIDKAIDEELGRWERLGIGLKLKDHPKRLTSEIYNTNDDRHYSYGAMPIAWEELTVVDVKEEDLFGLGEVITVIYIK